MQTRLNFSQVAPGALQAMLALQKYVTASGLEPLLMELVKVRASQINGCAYCLDMHTKDARAMGETEQRLYGVAAWREAPFYNDRERAALEWTEALTLIHQTGAPDAAYEQVRRNFSEKEAVDLSMAIVVINGWNRLMVGFRVPAGTYQPPAHLNRVGSAQ